MSIPSITVMTPLLLSSFRCFPYGPRVSSPLPGFLSPRQLESKGEGGEREREDPTTLSRQILARIIGYERFRSWWHKFDVDRISGGFSISGGGEGGEEEPAMSEQISSAISRIWVKTPALSTGRRRKRLRRRMRPTKDRTNRTR